MSGPSKLGPIWLNVIGPVVGHCLKLCFADDYLRHSKARQSEPRFVGATSLT
jgi:hypothetical protein